ncbi:hypothetical protein Psi01_36760 [Planobispora siamensis]|uniref:Methyl-accepting chemotaxis protein n=2 Tax=Planobispora siamensis TaxID=936338 RepID=A0A8J3WMN7_9ACTN|nr:hypothetical protein Psi01_36760 [Planobispora siamensis]
MPTTSPSSRASGLNRVWRLFPSLRSLLMTLAISLSALVVTIQTVAAVRFARDHLAPAEFDEFVSSQLTVGVVSVLVVSAVVFWVSLSVTRPLRETLAFLNRLVSRDLTARIAVDGRDEVGQIGHGLNAMVDIMAEAIGSMNSGAAELGRSAERLTQVSEELDANANRASSQAGAVSAAADQVSGNVQTVAGGVEEMTSSIAEISKSASEAARVAASGVDTATSTNATVRRLGESSNAIQDVVRSITAIAEQTNLLALNATIEAARAGEAGKGFAVVAGEVKDLAQQAADATENISNRITAIQAESQDAVSAIGQISEIIAQVSELQTTIAAAVEEQTAVTGEMGRSVNEAATSSTEIAHGIADVAEAAHTASSSASQTREMAQTLRDTSGRLRSVVERFTV